MGVEESAGYEELSLADEYMLERYRELTHDYQRMVRELVAALHLMVLHDKPAVHSNGPLGTGTPPATPPP